MKEVNIALPNIDIKGGRIHVDLNKPYDNIVSIDNTDYIPYYLNNSKPGNRGSNSYVLKLIEAQNIEDDDYYPETPDLILKICKFFKERFREHKNSLRFQREILALMDCNEKKLPNIVRVEHHGFAKVRFNNSFESDFRYYTMEYAENDLSTFLKSNNLDLSDRLQLGIDICSSLDQLWSLGYYHRDIKPDNILFIENSWMISDLGLINHRHEDFLDEEGEWIGPRGWMSPESMNKYLTEKTPWNSLHDCHIDHQSDIFQVGKVLWYILQGNTPEGGLRRNDFLWKNETVYQIVRTMLNNSKNRRFKSIASVIDSLEREKNKIIRSGKSTLLYS